MFMTHVQFPAKGVLTIRFWRNGALIEKAWQQAKGEAWTSWEPCDPQLLKFMGNAVGEVLAYDSEVGKRVREDGL